MKILYVGMKYSYGKAADGESFEHVSFFDSLRRMGHEMVYFDFMALLQKHGRKEMNRRLLQAAEEHRPDVLFAVIYEEELEKSVMRRITASGVRTVNWFCDDHWRFAVFSRYWAPCFEWVVTTDELAMAKYQRIGYRNAILSQWGCNPFLYHRVDGEVLKYDVTFVGHAYGHRRQAVDLLGTRGIDARGWGGGWPSGRVAQDEMVRIFNQSRVNLNFTQASTAVPDPPLIRKEWVRDRLQRVPCGVEMAQFGGRAWRTLRGCWGGGAKANDRIQAAVQPSPPAQIKGRIFEVPACGGFLLTERVRGLDRYYAEDREMVLFDTLPEMAEKAEYYLNHDAERAAIAQAGYERTLREHTYMLRLTEVFSRMGLDAQSPAETGVSSANGRVVEVE